MTAVNANAKQLAAIEAVASKVNGTEIELNALAERTTRQAVALCLALWRHTCRSRAATPVNVANPTATTDADDDYVLVGDSNTTAAAPAAAASAAAATGAADKSSGLKFAVDTAALRRAAYDLRMGTHWRDEALMQQLFALDNVFGDEQVKAKRKEQVTRIKALIARAEHLRVRNRRLDALLKRLPQPPTPEPASPTPSASAAADGEVKYAEPAALAAAAAGAADAAPQPMETDAQSGAATAAAAPAAAPRAATPPPAAPKSPALSPSALDVKHAPEQAAAIAAAAAPAKAASRPATPEKAEKKAAARAAAAAPAAPAPARPATPPKAAPSPAPAAAAAAAAEDDAESGGFVIPAKVKAQWPRLRAEFDTRDAGDSIHLSAALPGVLPQDLGVSLSADNTVLTVRGLKRPQPPQQRVRRAAPFGGWFGSAYDYEEDDAEEEDNDFGWFEEQFSIPARLGVDAAKAERVFRGGRLTIVLPRKAQPQPQSQPQARNARCAPAYAQCAQPQYYYRQPQPSPFAAFGGGHPFFGGRTGGWF